MSAPANSAPLSGLTADQINAMSQEEAERIYAAMGGDGREQLIADRVDALEIEEEARRRFAERKRAGRPRFADELIDVRDLDKIPSPRMLMDELLPHAGIGFLAGKWGSYKSFLATSWSCHLAAGTAWQGREEFAVAEPVKVLYVASEGASGIKDRVRAWELAHGDLPTGSLAVYPKPVRLNSETDAEEVAETVAARGFGFVVIDTYHRSAPGTDENHSAEFGLVFDAMARIRDEHGTTALFVDHTGHAGGRPRGTSAKEDDADFVLIAEMDGDDRGEAVQRTLCVRKRKDLASEGEWDVRLHLVPEIGRHGSAYIELGSVDNGAGRRGDDSAAWRIHPIPAELADASGAGAKHVPNMARLMSFHALGDPDLHGLNRSEVLKMLELKADNGAGRQAWSRLRAEEWIKPTSGKVDDEVGRHIWNAEKVPTRATP